MMTEDNRERRGDLTSGGASEDGPRTSAGSPDLFLSASAGKIAFSQLLSAVQQCGLSVNTDAIVSVRDCEYGSGRYQQAIDVISAQYRQLDALAAHRQGDLRREELRYKSGALKMSPREWQARRRRVLEQTQKIEVARRQFARLIDSLNVLRAQSGGT